jgi:hypothetical protein
MTNLYKCKIKLYQAQDLQEGNESYLWIETGQDLKTWEEVKVTLKKTIQDNSRNLNHLLLKSSTQGLI